MKIGFTGHQRIENPALWPWVRSQFERALESQPACGAVLAALAIGGDQLFVEVALALRIPFEAVVPCSEYSTTFEEPGDRERYETLLSAASVVHMLPFTVPSEEAYLAAGCFVVDHTERLIALWNGKPAAGKGGTADVIAYALQRGRPILQVHSDHPWVGALE